MTNPFNTEVLFKNGESVQSTSVKFIKNGWIGIKLKPTDDFEKYSVNITEDCWAYFPNDQIEGVFSK